MEMGWKNSQFSANTSLYLGNGSLHDKAMTYYRTSIESRIFSIEPCDSR